MTDVRLHRDLVDAFCAGRLDRKSEAQLAGQVAQVYTCEPLLPNQTVAMIGKLTRRLGGQGAVLDWLAEFPGKPRLVSAVVQLNDLLGALSGNDAIVTAVREVRTRRLRQDDLAAYWAPITDHTTLSDLAETAKYLVRRDEGHGAVRVSQSVLALLDEALPLAQQRGADVAVARQWVQASRKRLELAEEEVEDSGQLLTR